MAARRGSFGRGERPREAEGYHNRSLEIEKDVGNRPGEATSYWALALLAEAQGDPGLAVERMGRAAGMMEEMGLGEAEWARGEVGRLVGGYAVPPSWDAVARRR